MGGPSLKNCFERDENETKERRRKRGWDKSNGEYARRRMEGWVNDSVVRDGDD